MNFWMSYICDVSHHLNYFPFKAECFHILCVRSQLYQHSSSHHPRSYTQVPFEAEGFHFLVVRCVTARIFIISLPTHSPVLLEAEGFHILGVRCQRGAAATATPARKQFLPEGGIYIFRQKHKLKK